MNYKELFTVIIPSKELCTLTKKAISSLEEHYPGISIILILDKSPQEDLAPNVHFIKSNENIGKKRNLGALDALTPYISFLDSDAAATVGWLEAAYNRFQSDKKIRIVAGPNIPFPEEKGQQRLSFLATKSFLVSGGNTHEKEIGFDGYVSRAPSCNMHVLKNVYLNLGGMDSRLKTGEDLELCRLFINNNYRIYFDKGSVVFHRNRKLKGLFLQRFTWGFTSINLYRTTKQISYLYTLVPFAFLVFLIFLVIFEWINLFFGLLSFYFSTIFFESIRITRNPFELVWLPVFILVGNISPGIGTFWFLIFRNFNIYKFYNNNN